jgi:alpha-1,6-mannosyltransferase
MKIVDVCAFYSPQGGGVKTYVEQKLAIGHKLGHEIVILAPGDDDAVFERGPNARIRTIKSPRFPLDRKYWYFGDEAALHAALDEECPDFVEASSPWRSPSMVARWQGGAQRSLVMHADPLSAYAYRWLEPALSRDMIDRRFDRFWSHLRELGRQYDQIVCANGHLRDRLTNGGVANCVTVKMGIEDGVFSPNCRNGALRQSLLEQCDLPPEAYLLIGVGRLASEKRWPMIVDAVTAAGQVKPVGLVILGAGGQRSKILRQIAGNPHIKLLSPVQDRAGFASILASADALIHGCEAETFCMAAAEARACGVPVIVPDQGGAVDHAADGAGMTYRSGSPLAATEAILTQMASKTKHRATRTQSRTMTEHFQDLFSGYQTLTEGVRDAA